MLMLMESVIYKILANKLLDDYNIRMLFLITNENVSNLNLN